MFSSCACTPLNRSYEPRPPPYPLDSLLLPGMQCRLENKPNHPAFARAPEGFPGGLSRCCSASTPAPPLRLHRGPCWQPQPQPSSWGHGTGWIHRGLLAFTLPVPSTANSCPKSLSQRLLSRFAKAEKDLGSPCPAPGGSQLHPIRTHRPLASLQQGSGSRGAAGMPTHRVAPLNFCFLQPLLEEGQGERPRCRGRQGHAGNLPPTPSTGCTTAGQSAEEGQAGVVWF